MQPNQISTDDWIVLLSSGAIDVFKLRFGLLEPLDFELNLGFEIDNETGFCLSSNGAYCAVFQNSGRLGCVLDQRSGVVTARLNRGDCRGENIHFPNAFLIFRRVRCLSRLPIGIVSISSIRQVVSRRASVLQIRIGMTKSNQITNSIAFALSLLSLLSLVGSPTADGFASLGESSDLGACRNGAAQVLGIRRRRKCQVDCGSGLLQGRADLLDVAGRSFDRCLQRKADSMASWASRQAARCMASKEACSLDVL